MILWGNRPHKGPQRGRLDMRSIDLATAVSEIVQAVETDHGANSPFFFLVGAGISYPSVKLAYEIQAECKAEAVRRGRNLSPPASNPRALYSHWFETAWPSAGQRQKYLRKRMENVVISRANFRLAHLMLKSSITNLVVTTNFDDLLTRALTLFGERPVVCDHPNTVDRIDPRSEDLQIIHVHGSYWHYDCCNLKGEMERRAESSATTTATMAQLLDSVLLSRSPLVLGYSGWDGDVFMSALKRRLTTNLRMNLYWFCYRRAELETLPEWLRDSPSVTLVAPPEPVHPRGGSAAGGDVLVQRLEPGPAEVPSLAATKVLDGLIQALQLEAPLLTKDPLGFFADRLKKSLPGGEETGEDAYALDAVLHQVEKAARKEANQEREESAIETLRSFQRRSEYQRLIQFAESHLDRIEPQYLQEAMGLVFTAGVGLNDNSDDEIRAYDCVAEIAKRMSELDAGEPASRDWRHAQALFRKGVALGSLNRSEDAIAVYDEVVRRFGEAEAPALREHVAGALVNKGVALGILNRIKEAIAVCDEVVRRFGAAEALALRERVARALVNKGVALGFLNRSEEAIGVYDEVVRRFGEAEAPALRERVARALFDKGVTLGTLNRSEEEVGVYDEVVRRFGEAEASALREQVAKARVNKGVALGTLDRSEDAIAAYDEVVRRFGEAEAPALREAVAKALVSKGVALGTLNRSEDAIAVYDDVVRRFGDAEALALREHVAMALFNKGLTLGILKRREDAIAAYHEVVRRFGKATQPELVAIVESAQREAMR